MPRTVTTRHQRLGAGGRYRFRTAAGRAAIAGLLLAGAFVAVNAGRVGATAAPNQPASRDEATARALAMRTGRDVEITGQTSQT
jgi:hypothetical protein